MQSSATPSDQVDDLDVLGAVLWSSAVEVERGRRESWPDGDVAEAYVAIPSLGSPQYLMPADLSGRAAARLLREYNVLRATKQRAGRAALAMMARAGYLPGRRSQRLSVRYSSAQDSLLGAVAEHLEVPRRELAMSCGVRVRFGVARPIMTIVDPTGTPVVFVKVARAGTHRRRLVTEHELLSVMAADAVAGLHTPAPVFLAEWGENLVLGTRPLPNDVRPLRPRDKAAALDALGLLTAASATSQLEIVDSPWLEGLLERASYLPPERRSDIERGLHLVVDGRRGLQLPHAIGHGDWSFWNLARSRAVAAVAIWDWEFGHRQAPVGVDRMHWPFAIGTTVRGLPIEQVLAEQRAELDGSAQGAAIMELHLLEMILRRFEDAALGNDRAGATAQRLLAALEEGARSRRTS